jgi:hypothetical protein
MLWLHGFNPVLVSIHIGSRFQLSGVDSVLLIASGLSNHQADFRIRLNYTPNLVGQI